MRYDIIKTEKYLLICDDSEIKIADWYFDTTDEAALNPIYQRSQTLSVYDDCKKIIAHLPLNGAPVLDGVPLLPSIPQEEDVEELADEASQKFKRNDELDDLILGVSANSFEEGYNKAREKYKFTEEDLRKAIEMAQQVSWDEGGYSGLEHEPNEIIQSLQQSKLPIGFECEVERIFKHNEHMEREFYDKPKTITNSEGRVE